MVLNLRQVVSDWPGATRVYNKDNPLDKEYVLIGKDSKLGSMWLGNKENPVEVYYVGKLPDGRFVSYVIMSMWDDGNYHLCWKFAADEKIYTQHVDRNCAFALVLDDPAKDNIKLTSYAPDNEGFEVCNYDVSRKIAGDPKYC